jgi:EAL domain-containing protein (putative c-di-GMP-specific phosphodiesterase class I)
MEFPEEIRRAACFRCLDDLGALQFSMAFQPIVDFEARSVYAYEALVRGAGNEPAQEVLSRVDHQNRYAFDQACRATAIRLASQLGVRTRLSINFLPNAVYQPKSCIQVTLQACRSYGFPVDRIIFEVTEGERIPDRGHLARIFEEYRRQGFLTAIDDFGEGDSGLNLLAEFHPDLVKLDRKMIAGVDQDHFRRAILRGVLQVCKELGIAVVAEGVETEDELSCLAELGVRLIQGFLIARPLFEALPEPHWPG